MASTPSSLRRARRVAREQAAANLELEAEASNDPRLVRRELGTRMLRALVIPPFDWGPVRAAFNGLSLEQLRRIVLICEEKK